MGKQTKKSTKDVPIIKNRDQILNKFNDVNNLFLKQEIIFINICAISSDMNDVEVNKLIDSQDVDIRKFKQLADETRNKINTTQIDDLVEWMEPLANIQDMILLLQNIIEPQNGDLITLMEKISNE